MNKAAMRRAVAEAVAGPRRLEGGPFGAAIVRNGRILSAAHNTVLKTQDPTCHAETNAIRAAARKLKSFDLSGCEIYSTTEPCPMCFAAIHWARLDAVHYGTSIADVRKRGFNELSVPSREMKRIGGSPVRIRAGFMRKECEKALEAWDRLPKKTVY